MKNKILVLCGKQAAGKSTIAKILSEEQNFKEIISITTRPIRKREIDFVDYCFITKEYFLELDIKNELIEKRKYNTMVNNIPDTWYYGLKKSDFEINDNKKVVVVDLTGLKDLIEYFGRANIVSIYLWANDEARKHRCIDRESYNEVEFGRRSDDDDEKFSTDNLKDVVDYVVENNDINTCVNDIIDIYYGTNYE